VRDEIALFVGAAAWQAERANLHAARALLERVGVGHGLVAAGRDSGYLAYTVGLHDTARELARATVEEIAGMGSRTLITLSPEDAHTLLHVYPLLGAPLPAGVEVVELTALLVGMLDTGRLRLRRSDLALAYHDPCQTPRLDGRWQAPRRLLAALTEQPIQEGFWREKRAAPCGASGGLPWTQPDLASGLARAALADAIRGGARVVVTEAPGCLTHLRAHAGEGVEMRGLYELLVEHLEA
jgi:Fe-S oxidoreductase